MGHVRLPVGCSHACASITVTVVIVGCEQCSSFQLSSRLSEHKQPLHTRAPAATFKSLSIEQPVPSIRATTHQLALQPAHSTAGTAALLLLWQGPRECTGTAETPAPMWSSSSYKLAHWITRVNTHACTAHAVHGDWLVQTV